MSAFDEDIEKKGATSVAPASDGTTSAYDEAGTENHGVGEVSPLKRSLQGRHMQMIAIGMFTFNASHIYCMANFLIL